jgi:hypothetical protein
MGLDTVAISIATEEESTTVELVIAAKDGAGSVQDYLNTVATSIAAAEEIRLVVFVAATEVAGKGRHRGRRGHSGNSKCRWRNRHPALFREDENSTAVSNPINLIPIGLDTAAFQQPLAKQALGVTNT